VMSIVTRDKAIKEGKEPDEKLLTAMEQNIIKQFDQQSTAFAASARLFDDGIIDPRDTRKVLGLCLSVCREARARTVFPNTFGVARL
jgi:geranyl-CoA carboxylase beta subunit